MKLCSSQRSETGAVSRHSSLAALSCCSLSYWPLFMGSWLFAYLSFSFQALSLHPTSFSTPLPSHHPYRHPPTPNSMARASSLSPFHLLRRLYFTFLSP